MGFPQIILLMATSMCWGWLAWSTVGAEYGFPVLVILAGSFVGLHGWLWFGGWYRRE